MGVVSNGMLCSGDELGLTADADGILILPADTPLGAAAGRAVRRRRPRRRRQAEPRRRAVDRRARPRGRGGDRRDRCAARRPTSTETGPSDRRAPRASRSATPTCARGSSAAGSSGVTVGPSPDRVQMRLLAAGQRPISNVVDASNYVMVELGKPIHTFDAAAVHDGRIIVRRATAGRALRDARPRRPRARPRDARSSPTRRGPLGIAGVMGGADVRGRGGDHRRHRRVGHLRPDQHPPDGLPLRPALRGEPPLREGPGVPPRADRRRPDGRASSPSGPAARSRPGAVDSNPAEPPLAHVAFRPARVNRLLGHGLRDRRAARAPRPGRDRDGAGRAGHPGPRRGRHQAARRRARRRRGGRGDRPDLAARPRGRGRHRRGGRSASAATSSSRRPCRTRRCRRTGHDPLEVRDAVRETLAGAGLTEAVTFALVAPRLVERFPAHDDGRTRR